MSKMDEKRQKDLRAPFPQKNLAGYNWQDPPNPNEPPPRSGQKCANCNAFVTVFHPVFGPNTLCAAEPPKPICLGMGQTKTINAKTGQPDQFPIIQGFQPPTSPEVWCRAWKWAGPGGNEPGSAGGDE